MPVMRSGIPTLRGGPLSTAVGTGLMPHQVNPGGGYGLAAMAERIEGLRYPGILSSFQSEAAQERMMGERFPMPYQAVRAELNPIREYPDSHFPPMYRARQLGGQRRTMWGDFARDQELFDSDVSSEARHTVLAPVRHSRDRFDGYEGEENRQTSGRLSTVGESFNASIPRARPNLVLEIVGNGMALMTVEAGQAMGGAVLTRQFVLGNGFTAGFELGNYSSVLVRVDSLDANIRVQWSFTNQLLLASDRNLYLPQYLVGGVEVPVPSGAFAVIPALGAPGWQWRTTQGFVGVFGGAGIAIQANVLNHVMGGWATPPAGSDNQVLWVLRPF